MKINMKGNLLLEDLIHL